MTLNETKPLERCVRGTTQNPNECIISLVRARCLKHKHHAMKVIHCAVISAVLHFHSWDASREKVTESLSSPAGKFTRMTSLLRNKKRAWKSDLQANAKEKKHWQAKQLRQTQEKRPFMKQKESLMKHEPSKLNSWTFCTT